MPSCGRKTRTLLLDHQILIVLRKPLGSAEFVQRELAEISVKHQFLLDRIPQVQDLQSAWFLLLFFTAQAQLPSPHVAPRGHPGCSLRNMIAPSRAAWNSCSTHPSQTPPPWPSALGGLVLRSASRGRCLPAPTGPMSCTWSAYVTPRWRTPCGEFEQ